MRDWLVRSRAVDESLSTEESCWLANRNYIEQLLLAQRLAIDTFKEGVFDQSDTETKADGRCERHTRAKKSVGLGDARMLAVYLRAAKDLRDARVDEAKAAQVCAANLTEVQPLREDQLVANVERIVASGGKLLKRLAKRGYPTALPPKISRAELIAHARKTFREQPTLSTMELLPDAWQQALGQAYLDPSIIVPAKTLPKKRRFLPLPQEGEGDAYSSADSASSCIGNAANSVGAKANDNGVSGDVTSPAADQIPREKSTHNSPPPRPTALAAAG